MEIGQFVTPGQVTGMGNPITPGENGETGSGDSFNVKIKPKRKLKSLKDYIKAKRENE